MRVHEGFYYEAKSFADIRRIDTGYKNFQKIVDFLHDWSSYRDYMSEKGADKIVIVLVKFRKEFDDTGMFLHEEITRTTVAAMEKGKLTMLTEEDLL